jgi:hypothetical protein
MKNLVKPGMRLKRICSPADGSTRIFVATLVLSFASRMGKYRGMLGRA